MRTATYASASAVTSETMCAASAISAREPNANPPMSSTARKTAFATSAISRARLDALIGRNLRPRIGVWFQTRRASGFAAEHLLDVGAQFLLGRWPTVRCHAIIDARGVDATLLVRRLV